MCAPCMSRTQVRKKNREKTLKTSRPSLHNVWMGLIFDCTEIWRTVCRTQNRAQETRLVSRNVSGTEYIGDKDSNGCFVSLFLSLCLFIRLFGYYL